MQYRLHYINSRGGTEDVAKTDATVSGDDSAGEDSHNLAADVLEPAALIVEDTANAQEDWRDEPRPEEDEDESRATASERIRAARERHEDATSEPRTEVTDYADATYTGRGEFYSGIRKGDRVTVRRTTVNYSFRGERKTAVHLAIQSQRNSSAWLSVYQTAAELEDVSDFRAAD